ncbi:MAG TPA: hypothetical protein VIX73_06550 [Kofleriaceae bacterium]
MATEGDGAAVETSARDDAGSGEDGVPAALMARLYAIPFRGNGCSGGAAFGAANSVAIVARSIVTSTSSPSLPTPAGRITVPRRSISFFAPLVSEDVGDPLSSSM